MTVRAPSAFFLGTQRATDELIAAIVVNEEMRAIKRQVSETRASIDAEIENERKAVAERERKRLRNRILAWWAVLVITVGIVIEFVREAR